MKYMQEKPLKWSNLKISRCPKCNRDFLKGLEITEGGTLDSMESGDMTGKMMMHPCGFMITEQRYLEIVSGMVIREL